MELSTYTSRAFALFFIRALLGITFFWQGFMKVFQFGTDQVYNYFFLEQMKLGETWMPAWLLQFTAYFTSYAELIGGALLVLGFLRSYTYWMMGIVLLVVAFGHGVAEGIWAMDHVMYRSVLLLALLLLPSAYDRWHLDRLVFGTKQ